MRILIATGGGEQSHAAVRQGAEIARAADSSFALLTVIGDPGQQQQGEAILLRAKTMIHMHGSAVQTRVRIGKPADEILREAADGKFDLLVIGDGSHLGFPRRLLAPTSERILAYQTCPVLIARGDSRGIRRILLCESGREPSLLSRFLSRVPELLARASQLTILHVMSQMAAAPGVQGWELRAGAAELMEKHTPEGNLLQEDLASLGTAGLQLDAKVRHGLVVKEILAEARSGDYDLVVIGAHRTQNWKRYLLDDLAREIVEQVDRPLLVVA